MRNKLAKQIRRYNRSLYPITPTETPENYKRDIRNLSKENKKLLITGLIRRSQPKSIISRRQARLKKLNIFHSTGIPKKITITALMKRLKSI